MLFPQQSIQGNRIENIQTSRAKSAEPINIGKIGLAASLA